MFLPVSLICTLLDDFDEKALQQLCHRLSDLGLVSLVVGGSHREQLGVIVHLGMQLCDEVLGVLQDDNQEQAVAAACVAKALDALMPTAGHNRDCSSDGAQLYAPHVIKLLKSLKELGVPDSIE